MRSSGDNADRATEAVSLNRGERSRSPESRTLRREVLHYMPHYDNVRSRHPPLSDER